MSCSVGVADLLDYTPMPHDTKQPNPADVVRASQTFLNWKPSEPSRPLNGIEQSNLMKEQHYAPADLAEMWGVSVQTIREFFKDEEGVLKLGSDGTRNRRAYKTLRIPHSVAERVHTKFSA
jgi:hypothetical protein